MSLLLFFNANKTNPIFATIISLYGLGIVTFLLKDIPQKFISFIKKHTMTSLSISSYNISYYVLMDELINGATSKLRSVRLMNGRWGQDEIIKTVNTGNHFIVYKKVPLFISVVKEDSKSYEDKITMTLTKFGRSHKFFDELVSTIKAKDAFKDPNTTKIYQFEPYIWHEVTTMYKRKLESIIIQKEKLDSILSCIDNFIANEKFYIEKGIPYQLGIILEGPPGTGKTSLIKAIAGHYNRNVSTISPQHLCSLQRALVDFKKNSILVIEDIDSNTVVYNREDQKEASDPNSDKVITVKKENNFIFGSISDVLNSIDGLISLHGRILIMTTNHIEKLDPALLRPGRIDLQVKIGYTDQEMFNLFLNNFFNKTTDKKFIKNNISVTTLQNEFLQKKTFQQFEEKYCE